MDRSPKHGTVLGVKVSITDESEVIDFVEECLRKKRKFFITTPNPEIIVQAQNDQDLKDAINSSDLALPDGVGLRFAGIKQRVTGRAVFRKLLRYADKKKLKVYLLGASSDVNSKALKKAQKIYPSAKTKGTGGIQIDNKGYSVTERDKKMSLDIIKDIDGFNPHILFVAFGAPKQEKWIYHNLHNLNIGGAMVVGGAFDSFVGKTVPPPKWMANAGLEWFWRMVMEPSRFRRILNATVVFPLLVLRQKITNSNGRH
jgi:N-acetylglucosaminyldiphosphoundecaprenol N-acetyl-beta-D-mannosaminyltransferase